ncbi:serine protease [Xylella fastidiosa]|uniref:trypsin-like serine peptidase n=1 Tax=Xylella fastidiosa TaxID=2371 RepID=UPI0003D369D2|nr:hypothetical protein [Xylella fastidiosa]ALR04484.1 serine protease [Xylella fastidiosa]KXB21538.1 peptidase [Xylella fastidiosa]OJZ70787.1 peptidase [Xylella fastidiosa 6c]
MSQFQKNRFYFANTVVFTLLVLLSLGAQAKPSDNEVVVQSISQEEQNAALEYWTPERMAATQAMQAQAIKMINDDPGDISESKHISTPAATEILTAGLLFFRVNGEDSSCTANVVQAATKSVVATAGHCVQSPANEPHERIDHLVFLLNYNHGRWDGRFPVRNIYTVNGWSQQGIDGFDFAFLSVAHNNYGSRPGDLVIQTPIRFAAPPTQGIFSLYGYPNAIDEGEHLVKCSERAVFYPDPHGGGPRVRSLPYCRNFSEGASGGPALQNLPDGTYQTGNVEGYVDRVGAATFTYWEAAAHGAWDRAQHDQ